MNTDVQEKAGSKSWLEELQALARCSGKEAGRDHA